MPKPSATRDRLVESARYLFWERGFAGTSMADLLAHAGVNSGSFYHFFESKEALLKALIQSRVTPIVQTALAAATEAGADDPAAALRAVARMMAERLREPANFAVPRLVIAVAARFPEIADYYRSNVAEIGRAAVERLIAQGVADGVFRAVDPRAASRAFSQRARSSPDCAA